MKTKAVIGMVLMLVLLSLSGCYLAVGGYGWERPYHHDHDSYYSGPGAYYHGGYYNGHDGYRGWGHDRD